MDEGYNPFPFPQPNNPFNDQAKESGAKMQSELRDTLRSFRDSLAFSFQTLNLTLASLNNSVRTVGIKISQLNTPASMQYVPPTHPLSNAYYGSMSRSYADFMGNRGMLGVFTADQPYNVNPLEFWREKQGEEATRLGGAASAFSTAVGEELLTYGAGIAGGNALARVFGMGGSTLAKFAFGAPAAMLASQIIGAYAQPFVASAQEHSRDVAAVRRMSGRFSTPFTIAQSQDVMRGIERLAYQETMNTNRLEPRLSMSGFRDITMMGLQADMFKGTTPEELVQQVASASQVVKFLTGVLGNKDVRETMETVKQLKNMGINLFKNPGMSTMLGNDAFGFGRVMGVDSATMMGMAANMSTAAFGQFGNPAAIGIQPAMRNLAYLSELEKRGVLSSAEMNAAGGVQAVGARMLDMQARMLNNSAIGDAILLSGWNGGRGFNMTQFRNNSKNGYFGSLASATRNFVSGGIGGMATFLMNRENIMADLATQGNIGEVLDAMLNEQLAYLPGINDMDPNDAVNLAALFLKEQYGVDSATAKASAMRVLRPSTGKAVEQQRNRETQLGMMELARAQHGPTRFFESIGEGWERIKSSVYENLVRKPAVSMSDAWINLADDTYESRDIIPQTPLTLSSLEKLKLPSGTRRGARVSQSGQPSARELEQAYLNLERTDSAMYSLGRLADLVLPGGTRRNTLDDIVYANAMNDRADFWSTQIQPGKRKTAANAVAEMVRSGLFKKGVNTSSFTEYFDDNYDGANANEIFRDAGDYLLSNLSESGRRVITRDIGERINSLKFRGLNIEDILNEALPEGERGKYTDANALYYRLSQSESAAKLQSALARNGITDVSTRELAAMATYSQFGSGTSGEALFVASGRGQMVNNVASAGDTGENASMFARGDNRAGMISLSRDTSLAFLKKLGMDKLDIAALADLSREDQAAVVKYITDNAYNFGKENPDLLAAIGNEKAQNLAVKISQNGIFGLTNRRVMANSIDFDELMTDSVLGIKSQNKEYMAGLNNAIMDAIDDVRGSAYQEQISNMVKGLGFTADGVTADNLVETLLSGKTTSTEGKRVTNQLKNFSSKSLSEQTKVLQQILSTEEFTKHFGEDGITAGNKDEMYKAQQAYALHLSQNTSLKEQVETKAKQAKVVKSAIDAAVDTEGHGLPYVRIKNVDAAINQARENLVRETVGITGPKTSDSFINWDFFKSTKNT